MKLSVQGRLLMKSHRRRCSFPALVCIKATYCGAYCNSVKELGNKDPALSLATEIRHTPSAGPRGAWRGNALNFRPPPSTYLIKASTDPPSSPIR